MRLKLHRQVLLGVVIAWMAGCGPVNILAGTPSPASSPTPIQTPTATLPPTITSRPTLTLAPSPTAGATLTSPTPVVDGSGDSGGTSGSIPGVNPLTGLKVTDPSLLDRRPMLIKVENLPREHRPQWGLSQADLVFEYYTEFGTTRFAALFYGSDAARVGPIRSARYFDVNLIRMYKAIFAFGSAYEGVYNRLMQSDFANRLVLEENARCPPMCRFEPEGVNLLVTSTHDLAQYAVQKGLEDGRPDLKGMSFLSANPHSGQPVSQIFLRFSGAIYNRWDYDSASGRYLRFVDTVDDINQTQEVYAPLTDRQNDQQIAADNLVVLLLPYQYLIKTASAEVMDMTFSGNGAAYAFRDGQAFALQWLRPSADSVVSLAYQDGSPYPFKPGQTWFEVLGVSSRLTQQKSIWKFNFSIP